MKNIRKRLFQILLKIYMILKIKLSIREAVDILSKNIVIFKTIFKMKHEKIIKILSGLPLFYIVIKLYHSQKYS